MSNGEGRGPDPDNWFDEPDIADRWEARVDRLAREREHASERDDWLRDAVIPRDRTSRTSRGYVAVAAGLLVAVLLGVLAAAGVFSGSPKPAAIISTPRVPAVTRPATTTTPVHVVAVPTTPLKPGQSGTAVSQLQRALARAGFSPGSVDGAYGAATTQAVTRFQQAHGLTADGIAGMQTLAALRQALQGTG